MTLYHRFVDVDEEHGCGDLPEDACREVPGNAGRHVVALGLQKVGDALVDAKTVLPWAFAAVGAPAALIGLLVPVREAGSLLPQAAMVPWVRRRAVRKWLWVLGAGIEAGAAAGIALVVATTSGAAAGWAILVALGVFAVGRALASIAYKDVLGRTIPKGQRGQVSGLTIVAAGAVALTVGLVLRGFGGAAQDPVLLAWLITAGAAAWAVAAAVFASVREQAQGADDTVAVGWIGHAAGVLAHDAAFRRFVLARSLLLVSALSPPFVVTLATRQTGTDLAQLGPFVAATGLAMIVGGPLWGRLADRSSRSVMMLAAGSGAGIVLALLVATRFDPLREVVWIYPAAYLLLALTHTGARIGRKTYLVDLAEGNRRTDYVALSNSAMGVVLLVAGLISGALAQLGVEVALAFLAALGLFGVAVARSLPEVSAPPVRER
jgi:hypothetical protein